MQYIQGLMTLSSDAATLYNKVEATLKVQERYFKKTLKQHSVKHYKDILKRNESLLRNPCCSQTRSSVRLVFQFPSHFSDSDTWQTYYMLFEFENVYLYIHNCSKSDVMDLEAEYNVTNLSHQYVLPVARGLVALILHNSANVDMFLLACKVSLADSENLYRFYWVAQFYYTDWKFTL